MATKNYNILIVDDDEFLLDIYTTKFKEAGHTLFSAHGGEEALELLRGDQKIDIVLLDIVMPVMDGLAFLETLRKEKLAENATVIVLSNQGQDTDVEKAKKFDVDGYIVKASTIPSEVLDSVMSIAAKKNA